MENNRKGLRNWGGTLLIFAICDALTFISSAIAEGDMFETIAVYPDPLVAKVAMVIAVIILVLVVALIAMQVFIGVRGLQLSKNPTAARGHIRVAKVLTAVEMLFILVSVMGLFEGEPTVWEYLEVIVCGANVAILFFYVKYAKSVRESVLLSMEE